VSSGFLALIWFHIEYIATRTYFQPKLAVIPGGFADEVLALKGCDVRRLEVRDLNGIRYDGIVADFDTISADDERFLARCALSDIPVYNAKTVYESLTGRVKIDKMSENNIGSLLPSAAYEFLKPIIDWIIVAVTLPIVVPVGVLTAFLIRVESSGPIF